MSVTIDNEINRTARFGQVMEDLVYNEAKAGRLVFRTKNDDLLISYWSMIFDYCKGIGCLLHQKFHSPAFAAALSLGLVRRQGWDIRLRLPPDDIRAASCAARRKERIRSRRTGNRIDLLVSTFKTDER